MSLLSMYGCGKDYLILISFRLPQISSFTLSLKCFSSDSDNCPTVGIRALLQFPHLPRAGPVLLTLVFPPLVPSSYRVLHGSIYYFLLVRYPCPLSAGFLHALLCLEGVILMYPWREMYSTSTYSSTILFSPLFFFFLSNFIYLFVSGCTGSPLLHGLCSSCSRGGLLSSCGAPHCGGFSGGAQALGCAGSGAVSQRPHCSVTCGILPDQGSNLCLLHWQADSLPLSHQGNPSLQSFTKELSVSLLLNQPGSPNGESNTRQKNPCWVLTWEGQ